MKIGSLALLTAATGLSSLPCLGQDHRPLFNPGAILEYSSGVSTQRFAVPGSQSEPLLGAQDVDLLGAGGSLLFRLGEALDHRPPLAVEIRAVYRVGNAREGSTLTSFPAGSASLAFASVGVKTEIKEVSLDLPVRLYFGTKRRWLEGPYLMAGPAWCHVTQTVDLAVQGSTSSGPASVASQATFGESRAGVVAGLGWTFPVRDSFFNGALTWRRLNGGTVQAQQRVTLSLGWLF